MRLTGSRIVRLRRPAEPFCSGVRGAGLMVHSLLGEPFGVLSLGVLSSVLDLVDLPNPGAYIDLT